MVSVQCHCPLVATEILQMSIQMLGLGIFQSNLNSLLRQIVDHKPQLERTVSSLFQLPKALFPALWIAYKLFHFCQFAILKVRGGLARAIESSLH